MLGIWGPNLEIWKSFLAVKGKCMLLSLDAMIIRVDNESPGDFLWSQ